MLARIAQNQEKRQRLQEQRDRERREMNDKNEDASKEKLAKIKATTDGVVNGKVWANFSGTTYLECGFFNY